MHKEDSEKKNQIIIIGGQIDSEHDLELLGIGRKIIFKMNKDKKLSEIEIHEGEFENNELKYGRIFKKNTISIGRFINNQLEGYGKKILPNYVIKEGLFKSGSIQEIQGANLLLKERWLVHFSDDYALEQIT